MQYSCLENPMDGGAWRATVRGVAKSWTRLHFHGDVFELSRRGWVVFNVLCLGSQDNCDLLTRFLYKGNKYIFKEVLGALRSTRLSPQWVSPQGFQKAPMFYSKNWDGTKLSHMHLALLVRGKKSSSAPHVWSRLSRLRLGAHLPPVGTILPFPFGTWLSPEILLIL